MTMNDLHPQAMDLAEQAFWHQRKGENEKARPLFLEALALEQQAAALLAATPETEPSRSILYRSAASLAFHAGAYETADWLIAKGLAGSPPPEIREELVALADDVRQCLSGLKAIRAGKEQFVTPATVTARDDVRAA